MEKQTRREVFETSVSDFIKLPPHPCQRDTEEHANYAGKRYLKKASPAHSEVRTIDYNGVVHKLDAHTRAYLWAAGRLEAPSSMLHDLRYFVQTKNDFESLYYHFDEKQGGKSARATLDGVVHAAGFNFKADLLKKNAFMKGVFAAMNGSFKNIPGLPMTYDLYASLNADEKRSVIRDVLDQWGEVFKIIDEIGPKAVKTPVITAMFMSVRRYGRRMIPFWTGVINDTGFHQGGIKDAIQAAHDKIQDHSRAKTSTFEVVTGQLLSCVEDYVDKKYIRSFVRRVELPVFWKKMVAEPMPTPAVPGLSTFTVTKAPMEVVPVVEAPARVVNVGRPNSEVLTKLRDGDITYREAEKLTGLPKSALVRQLKKNGSALPTAF